MSNSPAGIPIFQFKTVIVAAGVLMLIQGIAQVLRCIICIRTGESGSSRPRISRRPRYSWRGSRCAARAFRVVDGARGWTRPQREYKDELER